MDDFEKELTTLINKHSVENKVGMPDFILAKMICNMIEAMGPSIKLALDWHGCDSICHPLAAESHVLDMSVRELRSRLGME
jgi:hypothetical protein